MKHVITSKWSALPKEDGPRLPSGAGPGSPHHLQTMALFRDVWDRNCAGQLYAGHFVLFPAP